MLNWLASIYKILLFCALLSVSSASWSTQSPASYEIPPPGKLSQNNQRQLKPIIQRYAQRHKVPTALVHAVIAAESGYNPQAVSSAGAIGLMQLMPATAADYGVEQAEDLYQAELNIDIGTQHLKKLLRRYRNISHALAAYNAGEGAAQRYRRAVPYLETRKYVVRVLKFYERYKKRY